MVARRPQGERADAMRARIVEAALAAIREQPVANVQLAAIAERAGLRPGHVLYYFASRDAVLVETVRVAEGRLADVRTAALARVSAPLERLDVYVEHYLPDDRHDPVWKLWLAAWLRSPAHADFAALGTAMDARWRADLVAALATRWRRAPSWTTISMPSRRACTCGSTVWRSTSCRITSLRPRRWRWPGRSCGGSSRRLPPHGEDRGDGGDRRGGRRGGAAALGPRARDAARGPAARPRAVAAALRGAPRLVLRRGGRDARRAGGLRHALPDPGGGVGGPRHPAQDRGRRRAGGGRAAGRLPVDRRARA